MTNRDPNFDAYVLKIHSVLDRLDYYRLLGVRPDASKTEVKKAFYGIAKKFHPDRNREAAENVREALYDIYKRLNEAYGVLSSEERHKFYDALLTRGKLRLDQDIRESTFTRKPEDNIQSKNAREFYLQAKAELEQGSLMQADLHIRVANGREPGNAVIQALMTEIQAAKSKKRIK